MKVVAGNVLAFQPPSLSLIKHLLWTDVLTRATSLAEPVTLIRRAHVDLDTLGYWEFLDRWAPSDSYSEASRADLERLYDGYRGGRRKPAKDRLRPYVEAVDNDWLHPAGRRVLDMFAEYSRLLDVPGAPEVHNGFGGIDRGAPGTAARHLTAATGAVPPRLTTALLDLAPAMCRAEPVVVVHDAKEANDFALLRKVAARNDRPLHAMKLHDVEEGSLADFDRVVARARDEHSEAAVRLGLRLYFIAVLGQNERQGFQPAMVMRWIRKADRLIAEAEDTGDGHIPALEGVTRHGYVSPYDLTTDLLNRRRDMPRKTLLESVYL